MKKTFIPILFLILSQTCWAQRCGFICYDSVFYHLPGYKEGQHLLNEQQNDFVHLVEHTMENMRRHFDEVTPHSVVLPAPASEALHKTLENILNEVNTDIGSKRENLRSMEAELKALSMETFEEQLTRFRNFKGIPCIVEKALVLYCDDCVDYSREFNTFLLQD